jgi:hypothetical protein
MVLHPCHPLRVLPVAAHCCLWLLSLQSAALQHCTCMLRTYCHAMSMERWEEVVGKQCHLPLLPHTPHDCISCCSWCTASAAAATSLLLLALLLRTTLPRLACH